MSFKELYHAFSAQNTHDKYLRYSPLQHAFERSPDHLGHLAHDQMVDPPVLTEPGSLPNLEKTIIRAMMSAERE